MGWWAEHCPVNPRMLVADCGSCCTRTCHTENCHQDVAFVVLRSGRTRWRVRCEGCRTAQRDRRRALRAQESTGASPWELGDPGRRPAGPWAPVAADDGQAESDDGPRPPWPDRTS